MNIPILRKAIILLDLCDLSGKIQRESTLFQCALIKNALFITKKGNRLVPFRFLVLNLFSLIYIALLIFVLFVTYNHSCFIILNPMSFGFILCI